MDIIYDTNQLNSLLVKNAKWLDQEKNLFFLNKISANDFFIENENIKKITEIIMRNIALIL